MQNATTIKQKNNFKPLKGELQLTSVNPSRFWRYWLDRCRYYCFGLFTETL